MVSVTNEQASGLRTGRPGRKRSEDSRQAILAAAFELFGELGYAALTIEGVAAWAGVGKQTIYRWWPSKADVLLDALAVKADMHIPVADQGSYRTELRTFLDSSFVLSRRPQVAAMLCALMAQAQTDPAFGDRFREVFLLRRRDALATILNRAGERGDLPAHPSPGVVQDLVFGVIWYRMLATRVPLDAALTNELLHTLTGSHPRPPATTPTRKGPRTP